jgi:NADH-quinone oxidoreductase subunit F
VPDLHFTAEGPSVPERDAIDALLTGEARRDLLLPALHAVNDRAGWISPGALNYLCERLEIPPAEAYGVATFYGMFSTSARPPVVVHVCDDIGCIGAGAERVCAAMEKALGPAGAANEGARVMWQRSPCLGACERAPATLVVESGEAPSARTVAPVGPEDAPALALHATPPAQKRNGATAPHIGGSVLRLLRRVGRIHPESLDDYRAHDGYRALRRALSLGPAGVIREVTLSKLVGRGGAAFPTGR